MLLTNEERATFQALTSRGYSEEDAYEIALDGVSVEEVRDNG